MTLLDAIILGLVEGVTEYLPVSSTGHLIIVTALLGLDNAALKPAIAAFSIVVQGGAILAVLGLYWPRIVQMLRGLAGRDPLGRRLAINIIVAFLPAAILGPLLADAIKAYLFRPVPVLAALALGGIWMIWLDRWRERRARRQRKLELHAAHARETERTAKHAARAPAAHVDAEHLPADITLETLDYRRALLIGLFQVVALWPGASRSMMTIAGGTLLGMRPKAAAEFSFLLGLPTLGGACIYTLAKDYWQARHEGRPTMLEQLGAAPVVVGIVVATAAAAVAIRFLVAFLNRHGLAPFGWYRIVLAALLGGAILLGIVSFGPAQ